MSGLKDEIRVELLSEDHLDMDNCFAKARIVEDKLSKQTALEKAKTHTFNKNKMIPYKPPPKPQPQIFLKGDPRPAFRDNAPIRYLTTKERDERYKAGLCGSCDEKWVKGHKCKRFQLLVVVDDDEDENDQTPTNENPQEPLENEATRLFKENVTP